VIEDGSIKIVSMLDSMMLVEANNTPAILPVVHMVTVCATCSKSVELAIEPIVLLYTHAI
jgi:hypothetical protein